MTEIDFHHLTRTGPDNALPQLVARILATGQRAMGRLAHNGSDAQRQRAELSQEAAGEQPRHGGIFAALRRSPMGGVELDFTRDVTEGRDLDLWHAL